MAALFIKSPRNVANSFCLASHIFVGLFAAIWLPMVLICNCIAHFTFVCSPLIYGPKEISVQLAKWQELAEMES